VTVQAADLTQALATGVVSTFMTSAATGYDSKVWEQLKYYYPLDAWLPKNLVIVSRKAFDGLDKPTQEAVLKAAAEAETRGWKTSQEKTAWYTEQLKQHGMTVDPGSATLKADMKKIGEQMAAEWEKQTGAEGQAVLAAFRK
jgi:TRAP-type transport system periplasmic protein